MTIREVERVYVFEITKRQMLKLMKLDDAVWGGGLSLMATLLLIKPVRRVEYHPMTGCAVYCHIETEGIDIPQALCIIQRTILNYLKG